MFDKGGKRNSYGSTGASRCSGDYCSGRTCNRRGAGNCLIYVYVYLCHFMSFSVITVLLLKPFFLRGGGIKLLKSSRL